MYAVIATGGKQYRVEEGERLEVELLGADTDASIELRPVMVVDGPSVLATPSELEGASVQARIIGESKGPKIDGLTYKSKTNQRRRWGHRQRYSEIEITGIQTGASSKRRAAKKAETPAEAGDSDKEDA